jgi:hypothetical protein
LSKPLEGRTLRTIVAFMGVQPTAGLLLRGDARPVPVGEFGRARRGPLGAPLGALGGDAGSHARTRHDGCGGHAGKAELLTGIEGVSSRPVRKIVLRVE